MGTACAPIRGSRRLPANTRTRIPIQWGVFRVYTSSARTAADRFGRVYQTVNTRVAGQPSWVVKAAVVAGVVVFVAVVALLVIPAVLIGAVVLAVLGGAWAVKRRVAGWFGRGGGGTGLRGAGGLRGPRRNVRVIERREGR